MTTEPILLRAEQMLRAANLGLAPGGGSRAYFTQLNRAEHLPLRRLAFAGYSINPQVHAFDNTTLVESLPVQALTAQNARAIVGDLPLCIGPVTLKPRFQATATGPDGPPFDVDPRQKSLFCAGWTVGSLRHLASAGAATLTYYETAGPRGVMEAGGGLPYPVYHVFADVGEFAGAEVLPVNTSEPLSVEALALRDANRTRVLVASFSDEPQRVVLRAPPFAAASLRFLDETTARQACEDRQAFRRRVDRAVGRPADRLELELLPFAVACVDLQSAPG